MRTELLPLPLPRQARSRPDHPAVIADGVEMTYAQLGAAADTCARRLAGRGVGAGERVAACLADGRAYAVLLHALARLEAVLVPLNTRLAPTELAWQLADCEPHVIVWDPTLVDRLPASRPDADVVTTECTGTGPGGAPGTAAHRGGAQGLQRLSDVPESDVPLVDAVSPDAAYTLVYTSGTSGRPRGAMLTHGNHVWSAVGSALRLGSAPTDRWLAPLPLFHVGGLAVVQRAALSGTTAVLHARFDADAVAGSLRDDRISLVSLVPTMLVRLLDAWGDGPAPSTLRAVLLGGGPADPALLARAGTLGFPIAATYGLTEATSQVATAEPAVPAPGEPALPAMAPLPFTEVRIVDDTGRELPPCTEGEILVRGPTVMNGYWRSPDVTASVLAGGWLHTRDVGRMGADGCLTVVGRRADLIVTGGENVYPAEVEAVLDRHPDVAESCVVGVPDAEWGSVVVAVVVPAGVGYVDPVALREHVRAQLAGYKVPRRYVRRATPLPRTAAGKLQRALVASELAPGRKT